MKAINVLRCCRNQYNFYFNSRFHNPETNNKSIECLSSAVRKNQFILSDIDINLLYLQNVLSKMSLSPLFGQKVVVLKV